MTYNEAFFALLLASRLATGAYIPLPAQSDERDADNSHDDEIESVITEVRVVSETSTPHFTYDPSPLYTYDPLRSFTYDSEPSFTYDPTRSFSYDPHEKRAETGETNILTNLIERDNGTLSHPPPNPTAILSAFRTRPLTSLDITFTLDPNAPASPDTSASTSAFQTKPQSSIESTSILDTNTPPPPNPTAIPSAFRTKPLTSLRITSILDPNPPAPPATTARSSSFSTKQQPNVKTTSLDTNTPPPPNPTAVPSAFRTKPLTSLKITSLLHPNAPAPTPSATKTKSTHDDDDDDAAIAAALLRMTSINAQNSLPSLIPIQALPSSLSTIDLLPPAPTTNPNALKPLPIVPTLVNGGTAYVLQSFTGTNLSSAYVTKAPTTAFQFVSPSRLYTYSAASELVHRTSVSGRLTSFTEKLSTGMATGSVSRTMLPGYSESLLGFVEVGPGASKTSTGMAKSGQSGVSETAFVGEGSARPTERASGEETQTMGTEQASASTPASSRKSASDTAKPSSTPTSSSSNKAASKTTTISSTSRQVSESSIPSTKTIATSPSTTSEEKSPTPAQLIGKAKGKAKSWTGDLRCIYPTPGCDKE
ncbi:hypothetical protein M409DRAFT_23108 [Zasmidium cellare ATCC 36951]|uniref:Uncharacterized protein n=1 Tax=Zasmidium cellare ATCC 36951 TaxID=1080233 RepID=A0A6A6CL68_ZASCE|nr:uncharacterized protein M409DRAFT_23108 [Zasmidium cellare ATCC 36951]KAF2166469.1 hypothetical protein M409DRAFT_23108 [Zasmidium cellare ATCC 36951]